MAQNTLETIIQYPRAKGSWKASGEGEGEGGGGKKRGGKGKEKRRRGKEGRRKGERGKGGRGKDTFQGPISLRYQPRHGPSAPDPSMNKTNKQTNKPRSGLGKRLHFSHPYPITKKAFMNFSTTTEVGFMCYATALLVSRMAAVISLYGSVPYRPL